MLNIKKAVCTFTKKKAKHCGCDGTEQESFSEQERFVWMEITFTLRKHGGYRTSGLGSRSFPVVRQAGRQVGR